MLISIIIPVYNVEQYIERCLRSVAAQTFDGEMECLLIDDCGSDNSVSLCEDFVSSYQGRIRFRIIHHERNQGLSAARNTGFEASEGDYVYFLDSDDELPDVAIEALADEARKHEGVEVVQGAIISEPDSPLYHTQEYIGYHDSNDWVRIHFFRLGACLPCQAWGKLVSRRFLMENNLRFTQGLIHEDELWSFYLYRRVSRISCIPIPTIRHYRIQGSIMTSDDYWGPRSCHNWSYILNEILDNLEPPHIDRQLAKYIGYQFLWRAGKNEFQTRNIAWKFVRCLCKVGRFKLAMLILMVAYGTGMRGYYRLRQYTRDQVWKLMEEINE